MIAAILITALVMGYPLSNRTRERDAARKEADQQRERADLLTVEVALLNAARDEAAVRRFLDARPVATVVPIRPKGGLA